MFLHVDPEVTPLEGTIRRKAAVLGSPGMGPDLWVQIYKSKVRMFAGQPDPADPAHFTIRYELDDQPHVIDGWLRDDDTVLLAWRPQVARP